jgi:hypothetical protein
LAVLVKEVVGRQNPSCIDKAGQRQDSHDPHDSPEGADGAPDGNGTGGGRRHRCGWPCPPTTPPSTKG